MAHNIDPYARRWLQENSEVRPCCIRCQGFAWWDGDYCCTMQMKIHQHAPATNPWMNDDILRTMKTPETCLDYRDDPDSLAIAPFKRLLELKRLEWEYLRQAQGNSFVQKSP